MEHLIELIKKAEVLDSEGKYAQADEILIKIALDSLELENEMALQRAYAENRQACAEFVKYLKSLGVEPNGAGTHESLQQRVEARLQEIEGNPAMNSQRAYLRHYLNKFQEGKKALLNTIIQEFSN